MTPPRPAKRGSPDELPHLLIVDDEPMLLLALPRMAGPGFRCTVAGDGLEAVDFLELAEVDVERAYARQVAGCFCK